MAQKKDLNISPYYDDFDPSNNFYKVLFKPGFPVQARELTSLQSILQNQVEEFGSHMFKEGSEVIPGGVTIDVAYDAVKLNATQFGIASASSSTRGFWLGGTNLDGIIQKVTISSTGNAVDFGNLIEKTKNGRACSNTTRLIKGAGVDNENRLTI